MRPIPSPRLAPLVLVGLLAACGKSAPPAPGPLCALPAPQASALPASQVLRLGSHAVGQVVSFPVPPGTGSVTILQQGTQESVAPTITYKGLLLQNTVVPWSVRVGGAEFYNDGVTPPDDPANWTVPNTSLGAVYFATSAPWTGTMTVPNTSNMLEYVAAHGGVPSGTWAVEVNDWARECANTPGCTVGDGRSAYPPGVYDVTVLLKPGAVPQAGTLDVTFYLVTDRFTQATAEASPSVARMQATLGRLLANAGVTPGAVRFVDLPAATKARFRNGVNADDGSPCGDVATILQASQAGNAMNLFLVNSLVSTQNGSVTVVGVDGTIPGPASVAGTVSSGALVSVEDLTIGEGSAACQGATNLNCGADQTAYVAAHETGHFLGLYHPTESFGNMFDPVKDTPTCPCVTCASPVDQPTCVLPGQTPTSANYEVDGNDCTKGTTCGGGDNLMFWLLGTRSTGALTAQQSAIVRANPLVQ